MSAGPLVRRYGDTDFVTSLRAIAALLVVVTHTSAFSGFGQIGANIDAGGFFGVRVFFVISGFSIATTYASAPNYAHYLTRRMFRIGPLYYFFLTLGLVLLLTGSITPVKWLGLLGGELDIYNYVMHLAFLSFLDHSIANSIIGVEWTIPVEVFWYLFLPLFIVRMTNLRSTALLVILLVGLDYAARLYAGIFVRPSPYFFIDWFPTSYGYYFLAGVVAYKLREMAPWKYGRLMVWIGVVVFMEGMLLNAPNVALTTGTATFLLIGFLSRETAPFLYRALNVRPLLFLGTISYSIYLSHFLIVGLFDRFIAESWPLEGLGLFAVVATLTIGFSTLTYVLIERPTNALGRKVADNYFAARAE